MSKNCSKPNQPVVLTQNKKTIMENLNSEEGKMSKETLEEVAESKYGTDMDSHRGGPVYDLNADSKRAFVKGAKWMQKRMYSEDEVESIWKFALYSAEQHDKFGTKNKSDFIRKDVEEFIEQFKKKQDE